MDIFSNSQKYTVFPKHLEHKFFIELINYEQDTENFYSHYKMIPLLNAANNILFNRLIIEVYRCFQKKLRLKNNMVHASLMSRKCFDNLSLTIMKDKKIILDTEEQETSDTEESEEMSNFNFLSI